MVFVIDASISGCWLLPNEQDMRAAEAYRRLAGGDAFAPAVWWFEARNLLLVCEQRGRLDLEGMEEASAVLDTMPIRIDRNPVGADVLTLARRHRLTVYDAAYLELATRLSLPLATLDKALAAAARAESVALVGA